MTEDLWNDILDELKNRNTWERNQDDWYRMRYEGIKRVSPPYKGAPDMHYPLIDSMIEKIKPFYIAQIYGQERLATFVSGKPQDSTTTLLAERLFDYTTKQFTNFERAIHTAIDYMLLYGHGPVKISYDPEKKQISLINIRPVYLIVPTYTEEVNKADWAVHVIHMSKKQYMDNPKYKKDDDFVKSITGKGENRGVDAMQTIQRREGITVGQTDKQIVLWEVYSPSGGKQRIDTISPMAGWDKPVRAPFYMPYQHNEIPIVDLRYELSDVDFYGARGIGEVLSQYELDLCKLWNHKLQWLDFAGQPNYQNSGGYTANTGNLKNRPGKILPAGLTPVVQPNAPLDFSNEMTLQRGLAEDRVSIPDLSSNQHLNPGQGQKGDVTARQISALMSQNTSGNDMRARIFRLQLQSIHKQIWALRCQYFQEEDQRLLEDFTEVPLDALHNTYRINPSGSADSYNKEFRTGKAMMRYQIFKGNPSVKQGELTKSTLEEDDPALVTRLYQEPQEAQATEMQRQAEEILLMQEGFPAQVLETDDDPTHILTIAQWIERRLSLQEPITPETARLLIQHGQGHIASMNKKRNVTGMAILQQPPVPQAMMILQGLSQADSQGNGLPGAPAGAQGASAGPPQPPPEPPDPNDKIKAMAALLTALASVTKAGVALTADDYNGALAGVGLPPLQAKGPIVPPKPAPPHTALSGVTRTSQ